MPRSYRVYTKRKLTEDPELAKGYVRKSRKQNETDEDPYLSVKYILKSELELLDTVLDKTRPDKDGEYMQHTNAINLKMLKYLNQVFS